MHCVDCAHVKTCKYVEKMKEYEESAERVKNEVLEDCFDISITCKFYESELSSTLKNNFLFNSLQNAIQPPSLYPLTQRLVHECCCNTVHYHSYD